MDTYMEIWNAVLTYCREKESAVSDTGFKLWLSDVKMVNFENNTVFLLFPSPVKMKIAMEHYGELISEALENVMGFKTEISCKCEADESTIFNQINENQETEKFKNPQDELLTFDNFIEGPSNNFAYRAAKAVAENPGGISKGDGQFSNYNPLFIYGKSGLGKTHILNAIKIEIEKNFPNMKILYVRSEDFTNEFIKALGKKTVDEFHDKFRNIDGLLIDDIQFIGGKQSTEEEFFHTFNSLVENGKQVVLTSDRPPKEIQSLTERLCSRFENGLLADIQPPEFETRCAIIKHKADFLNFNIDDNVVKYIAEKIKTNIRQLEGTTKRLYAKSKIGGLKPTIALAQEVIRDVMVLDNEEPVSETVKRIVEEVSRTEGVSVEDIYGKKRRANIVQARKISMYIIREITNLSYEMIGESFDKNYSTVIYNVEQLIQEMERDSRLRRKVNDIVSNIKSV